MADLGDELWTLLEVKVNELFEAGKMDEAAKMDFKRWELMLRRIHVDRLQEARNKRLAKDEKQIKDLEKKLDEEESKKKVIEKKLDKENVHSTRLRALKNSQKKQGASIDIEMKQNAIDMKGIQDDLKKQSDNCDGISDEIKRLRKRLEEDKENVAKKHQELFVYLSASIDDNQYQQLELDARVRKWFGLQVDEVENVNRFDDLWNILKSRGEKANVDYLHLEGWLLYYCNIFDVTHLTEEIHRIEDAILEPYDSTEKQSLSDYHKKAKGDLGRGGFGTVCLYEHNDTNNTNKLIAVKEINLQPNENTKKEDEAFMVEVKIMRELSEYKNPNIVQYLFEHFDQHSGKLYIGMEYMTGGSLTKKIHGDPLPQDELRNYTHQIISGVKFLHDKHIAHRDVKCDNILLDSNNRIKLADFGISKKLNTCLLTRGATTAEAGTYAYMSPEAVKGYDDDTEEKGHKGYGIKTDIWSVGCVVLEMATGKRPWSESTNHIALIFAVGKGKAPPVDDNVPDDVKDFLAKTFIVNPADRSSAKDLLRHKLVADLEKRYLENMKIPVAGMSPESGDVGAASAEMSTNTSGHEAAVETDMPDISTVKI